MHTQELIGRIEFLILQQVSDSGIDFGFLTLSVTVV